MGHPLADKLRDLPPGSLVPAAWVVEQLGEEPEESIADPTLPEYAEELGKSVSTIRGWCARIPGAYRLHGREWRIPRAAMRAYLAQQSQPPAAPPQAVDLGEWRKH